MPTIVSIEGFHYQASAVPTWSTRKDRGSDKCYLVALVDHGVNGWAVHAHWGRRNTSGSGTKWGPWLQPSMARFQFEEKQSAKLREGYRRVGWNDPQYGMTLWWAGMGTLPREMTGWITLDDAAILLGTSRRRVVRLIQGGQLASKMSGGFECVRTIDVEALKNSGQALEPPTTNDVQATPTASIAVVVDPEPVLIVDHSFGFGYRDRLTDVAFCSLCGQPQLQHAFKEPPPPPPRLVLPDRLDRDVRPRIQIRRDPA